MSATDGLSAVFGALSDPTRRAILERLTDGPASVSELAAPFDISLPAVSRHLKVLEQAGLISREKEAQWRRCRLSAGPLRDATRWMAQYRDYWDAQLDSLSAFLNTQKDH